MKKKSLLKATTIDKLKVEVYESSASLGKAAANRVADRLENIIAQDGHANLLLATGASQFDFLEAFRNLDWVKWSAVTTFHLDEYIGIGPDHPASFRKYLHDRIIDTVQPGESYFLKGDANDIESEIRRYEQLLKDHPIDIACIGIGENGHLAFNDPPVADFEDPRLVKVVELDQKSRQQQVDEGWFSGLGEVPERALSLTIPAIMQSKMISCVVPDERKAEAVSEALYGPVSEDCPASVLRTHRGATLFLDRNSASRLE